MTTSRSFALLCTIGVFCFISYNMVRMPALALFAESLGASPERIGLIVSVSTLTGVFLKLPSGALSDIYGRRMLLRIGVVAFGVPPFFYPFISDLDMLTLLCLFHGLATAIFAPSALATVAELYRERRGAARQARRRTGVDRRSVARQSGAAVETSADGVTAGRATVCSSRRFSPPRRQSLADSAAATDSR